MRLSDLLAHEAWRRARLLTDLDPGRIEVRSAAVVESPLENFVAPQELVVSAGVAFGRDEELFLQFVNELISKQAAGLALAVGSYVPEIPATVRRIAAAAGFPVLLLPGDQPFAALIRETTRLIEGTPDSLRELRVDLPHALASALAEPDFTGFARSVHASFQVGIIVVRADGVMLSGEGADPRAGIDCLARAARWQTRNPGSGSAAEIRVGPSLFLRPISVRGRVAGYLFIDTAGAQAAASSLTDAVRRGIAEEAGARVVAEFFLQHEDAAADHAGVAAGFSDSLGFHAATAVLERRGRLGNSIGPDAPLLSTLLARYLRSHAPDALPPEGKVAVRNDSGRATLLIQAFLQGGHRDIEELVEAYLATLSAGWNALDVGAEIRWGAYLCTGGRTDPARARERSIAALDFSFDSDVLPERHAGIRFFHDVRVLLLLEPLLENPQSRAEAARLLEPLEEYSRTKRIDLIQTLETFFAFHGNLSLAAAAAHLHRHTLTYRLNRIEELLELSLSSPQDRLLLQLCLRLR